jgi:hypothetical protein
MAKQFWIRRDGNVAGPFTSRQVARMAAAGGLAPTDFISPDQSKWIAAGKIQGLFKGSAAPSAPADAGAPPPAAAQAASVGGPSESAQVSGRPSRRSKWMLISAAAVVVLAAAGVAVWMLLPGGVGAVMRYAPPDAVGVIHMDVERLWDQLKGPLEAQMGDKLPLGMIEDAVKKLTSVDVFLSPGSSQEPRFLVAVRTSGRAKDVLALMNMAGQGSGKAAAKSEGNGRYALKAAGRAVTVICGSEADDLDDDVLIVTTADRASPSSIAKLGSGDHSRLRDLLSNIDTDAPIWAAVDGKALAEKDAPESIAASLFLTEDKESRAEVVFRAEADARKASEAMKPGRLPPVIREAVNVETEGRKLVVTARMDVVKAMPAIVASIFQARQLAQRAVAGTRLKNIGMAIELYRTEHADAYPPNLTAMIETGDVGAPDLLHPGSGRKAEPEARTLPGGSDFVYIRPAVPDPPGELVLAHGRSEHNQGQGAHVLYASGSIRWVSPARLRSEVQRTRRWYAEQRP